MSGGIFSGRSALGTTAPVGTSTEAQAQTCVKAWPSMYPGLAKQEDRDGVDALCAFGPAHTIDCLDKCKTAGMPPAQKWLDCVTPCMKDSPSDVGPTTQSRVPPSAFIKQPPKANTITTTKTPTTVPPLLVDGNQTAPISIPTWAWIVGAVGLAGLGWYFLGGKKKVRRNGDRVRMPLTKFSKGTGKPWSQADADYYWRKADAAQARGDEEEALDMVSEAQEIEDLLRLRRNGKIIASSFQRYNGGVRIKRLHGSSTVTRFYVFREEDRNDASKWLIVEGFGPTPGDRKTDAIRRSGLR